VTAVSVRDLRVALVGRDDDIVADVSFDIADGEILGLVGESGSGKTTVGTALLGHTRPGARITTGEVRVAGRDVLGASPSELRELRGGVISYVPQDPAAALNPALRVGRQLRETLEAHDSHRPEAKREKRIGEVLAEVSLPSDRSFLKRYPHQLSGGQQQRVSIAMAFVCRPKLIVCDEPTTGLDVTTQGRILATIRDLCATHGTAALYVSHDLGVVAELAQRVIVMYAGRLVEVGAREEVFAHPAHPYTRRLMSAVPTISQRLVLEAIPGRAPAPGRRPEGCSFAPRCPLAIEECRLAEPGSKEVQPAHFARCIRAAELIGAASERSLAPPPQASATAQPILAVHDLAAGYGKRQVLADISFELGRRECLALVGESGSGKTTLSRSIVGLIRPLSGKVQFEGATLAPETPGRPAEVRRRMQYIFQSPFNSLNPRRSVGDIVATPLRHFFGVTGQEARRRAAQALERVALSSGALDRYPDQLSGGERQRVAIARALICEPAVLICDEITSALDVSVQASIVDLLEQLRAEDDLSLLFVTHNLPLVRSIADRVVVMNQGRIVESGGLEEVLDAPKADYTRALIADTPDPVGLVHAGAVNGTQAGWAFPSGRD
jgi:peptide/nickel transport system ATP-binding protein